MGFRVEAGSIYIIDDTVDPPVIVLDSSEHLFHCTDLVSGFITLPARQSFTYNGGPANPLNINTNHFVTSINANANIVLGGFSVTTFGGAQGIAGLGVYDAGGTYMHYQDGSPNWSTMQVSNNEVTSVAAYTFIASGGGLYLNERVYLDAGTVVHNVTLTRTLLSVRFDYKLFVGTLT